MFTKKDKELEENKKTYIISKTELEKMLEFCTINNLEKCVLQCTETGIGTAYLISKKVTTNEKEQVNITDYTRW